MCVSKYIEDTRDMAISKTWLDQDGDWTNKTLLARSTPCGEHRPLERRPQWWCHGWGCHEVMESSESSKWQVWALKQLWWNDLGWIVKEDNSCHIPRCEAWTHETRPCLGCRYIFQQHGLHLGLKQLYGPWWSVKWILPFKEPPKLDQLLALRHHSMSPAKKNTSKP